MKKFIKYLIQFIILMVFQPGVIYLILCLVFSDYNPLHWNPVVYTIFFELVLFFAYISHRAITDKDDEFVDIESIYYNNQQNYKNN